MPRFIAVFSFALLALTSATAALAQNAAGSLQTYLNAPVWYLEYEVSFKSATQGSITGVFGPETFTTSLERVFSASLKLDLRSQGASISMSSLAKASSDGSAPTQAQAMKMAQDMMARIDNMANWMNSGVQVADNATDEESQAAAKAFMEGSMGPARLEYVEVVTGDNLVNEVGQAFKQTIRTTRSGTGPVLPDGPIMFEMDVAAKKYALTLPFTFNDMGDQTAVKIETVTRTEMKGQEPSEERNTNESSLASFPSGLTVENPEILGQLLVLRGDLGPSADKISGERSFTAHYAAGGNTPSGALVFRYTLTITPPAKTAATGKAATTGK